MLHGDDIDSPLHSAVPALISPFARRRSPFLQDEKAKKNPALAMLKSGLHGMSHTNWIAWISDLHCMVSLETTRYVETSFDLVSCTFFSSSHGQLIS